MFGLFKRKPAAPFTGEQCAVDISKDGMVINGTKLDVLVHLEAAEKLLGTPRGKKYHTSAETKEFLENSYGEGMVTNCVNYTWDDLGIYCYTRNGKVISSSGFMFRNTLELKHSPKKMFSGVLTINGQPWQEAIMQGVDSEFFRELVLGGYTVIAEYTDPFSGETPDDGGYNCVEISLTGE